MPQTVPVGEQVDGLNPSGRWVNAVDITRVYIEDSRPIQGDETTVELRFTNRTTETLEIEEPVSVNESRATVIKLELGPTETVTGRLAVTVPNTGSITVKCADGSDTRETRSLDGDGPDSPAEDPSDSDPPADDDPSPEPSPGDDPDTNTSFNPMAWVESVASTLGVSSTVAMGGMAAAVVVLGVLVL